MDQTEVMVISSSNKQQGNVIRPVGKGSKESAFTGVDRHVILLNKIFQGKWLDTEGNIGHEVIDFLLSDDGEYYVYNNPWGACPDDVWVNGTTRLKRKQSEKFVGKYMVLTSGSKNKDFNILYVVELKEKLHRVHVKKEGRKYPKKIETPKEIKDLIVELNAKYNNRYLNDVFDNESLCLTFIGSKIYKATKTMPVKGLKYNFQRNKGYIYDNEFPKDYEKVLKIIETAIANKSLVEFKPRHVTLKQIGSSNINKTFLDLIAMQDSEQVYTNILHNILSHNDLIKEFLNKFKGNKPLDNNAFKVFRETKVVDGRMDVCAESTNQRIIIENKVYSGLNGLKPADNKTQLSTYYNWAKVKPMKPLCFVVAPNFRVDEIKREIHELDVKMEPIYSVITYGDIADFIEEQYKNKNIKTSFIYYSLVKDIVNAFRNLSYSTKEEFYAKIFYDATTI